MHMHAAGGGGIAYACGRGMCAVMCAACCRGERMVVHAFQESGCTCIPLVRAASAIAYACSWGGCVVDRLCMRTSMRQERERHRKCLRQVSAAS